ncbi:hypothetical protein [uncultured Mailhella sp.]|uniref:hypothetical protein n=1 Tax=uncultured Mailhella sp. TaxID=1981031 RepID=UPI0025E28D7F|nr:hypothetical protein [uncultured Mailhella sp.]
MNGTPCPGGRNDISSYRQGTPHRNALFQQTVQALSELSRQGDNKNFLQTFSPEATPKTAVTARFSEVSISPKEDIFA